MDANRLQQEKQIIAYYLPENSYEFGNLNTNTPYLRVATTTNNNKLYVMRIEFPNYPYQKPNAYVEMMLKDYRGNPMNSASGINHTLEPHSNGWTQICHYHPSAWQPDLTLWHVVARCFVWLNIYEQTLVRRVPMETYLGHMDASHRHS